LRRWRSTQFVEVVQQAAHARLHRLVQCVEVTMQDRRIRLRVDGETVVVVLDEEFPARGFELELEQSFFQYGAVVILQQRYDQFAVKLVFSQIPIDVKVIGVDRRRTVFEYVQPPRIVAAAYAHVVRHDVENLAHAVGRERRYEFLVVGIAADLRVDRAVVDDVVPVTASGARLEIGRHITMADA
jgi:hypothetical protein